LHDISNPEGYNYVNYIVGGIDTLMDYRRALGVWGESLAILHLEAHGYQILDRNWRCRLGEIDIIARQNEELVFVEVKTRRGTKMGSPEEGLTKVKSKRLVKLSQLYLVEADLDVDWRLDLVAIQVDEKMSLLRLEHLPNAILGW
jgi:putative endonuclease